MFSLLVFVSIVSISVGEINGAAEGEETKAIIRHKRQLPLKLDCNVQSTATSDRCYKGDLIDESIADCKKTSLLVTCDPINKYPFSTTTDVPDVRKHGVNCVPVSGKPVRCGDADTRCVCDAPVDFTSAVRRPYFANRCRCQYWPSTDTRESRPAVCRQYDHGGTSGVHFYACCNNCNDADTACDGDTYQGGGSTNNYCGTCGNRRPSEQHSRHTYTFNCESCSQQRQCRDYCNRRHPLAKSIPGLCPKWAGCFRGCCLSINPSNRGKRSATVNQTLFCGDNICSDGETTNTCPLDCCPTVNPTMCPSDQCTPNCCMGPTCCLTTSPDGDSPPTNSTAGGSAVVNKQMFTFVVLLMVTAMYF